MFKIETLVANAIVAGKIKRTETHFIADAEGQPVTGKSHATLELAQAELDGLGNFQEGMAFAVAMFPELSDKAQKGKANVVAEYLAFVAGGRVAKVVEETKEEVATTEAPVAEEAEDEVEF